jgi:hypothetical protein
MTSVKVTSSFSHAIISDPISMEGLSLKVTVRKSVWFVHGGVPTASSVKIAEPDIKSSGPGV